MIVTSEAQLEPSPRAVPPAFQALVAPEVAMERQARVGKVKHALIAAFLCSVLLGFAAAVRVDGREATIRKLEMGGQMQTLSDRQIDDEVLTTEKQAMVLRVAAGAVSPFVWLLANALALVSLVWFLRGKVRGAAVLPVASAVLLPNAAGNLLDAVTVFRRYSIAPDQTSFAPRTLADIVAALGHPLTGNLLKLGNVLDFYSLWAALLMGFGVAAAGSIPARRAVVGTLVAWLCIRLLTQVAMGGGHP